MSTLRDLMEDGSRLRQLLLRLLAADTEDAVISELMTAGLWDDASLWRDYGDEPDNFSPAGSQQRNPEAALVEKAINSVDACLMAKVLAAGIDPRSGDAPGSPREAVAIFYEGADPGDVKLHQGQMAEWGRKRRTEVSRDITIALTGSVGPRPSITIADAGEGQGPDRMPETILSLMRGIKKSIPFVQGKFNMGGTGALRFCGRHNLQLVLSRRHPDIVAREGGSDEWGFTVVRRDDPTPTTRTSTYRYLAPVLDGAGPGKGRVLRFRAETLPIFPEGPVPYSRQAASGTVIKLYEYDTKYRTMMFLRDGLLGRLDIMMPGLILPIRLHECRPFKGAAERSFETTLTGLEVRLRAQEGEEGNLEPEFPDSGVLTVGGEPIRVNIYAFRRGRARSYRRGEGILFVVNGQTHAMLQDRWFRRKDVGMGYLADSLLIVLDCTDLADRTKEDLFMNSRDRLADGQLAADIDAELTDLVKNHGGLQALRNKRRQEDTAQRLGDAKPLEDVVRSMLRRSPSLARLFAPGLRLSNPFSTVMQETSAAFEGEPHPTYFRFRDLTYGQKLSRDAYLGQRLRLDFETDVVNDYFRRTSLPGQWSVVGRIGEADVPLNANVNLHNGMAHLNVTLPPSASPGDTLDVFIAVTDETLVVPFANHAVIRVRPEQVHTSDKDPGGRRDNPPPKTGGPKEEKPGGISLPEPIPVFRDQWSNHDMDRYSAMRAVSVGTEEGGDLGAYDYFINMDNDFLLTELKGNRLNPDVLRARYKYGMQLVALAAVRRASEEPRDPSPDGDDAVQWTAEDLVAAASDALAPVLLPMVDILGDLDEEAVGETQEGPQPGTDLDGLED